MLKMPETVQVVDVKNEGLISCLNKVVILLCMNYFYTGKLVGVNDDCVLLTGASIVYETGAWKDAAWKDAQRLPFDVYVTRRSIEAFGVTK